MPVTGRKTFDESFPQATSALPSAPDSEADARREFMSGSYWLGVIDIDRFQRVNDTHGHLMAVLGSSTLSAPP